MLTSCKSAGPEVWKQSFDNKLPYVYCNLPRESSTVRGTTPS